MSDYTSGNTHWLEEAPDWDTFWEDLRGYPPNHGIQLHFRDGSTIQGPFAGVDDASGLMYSPDPDGSAYVVDPDGVTLLRGLRVHIIGFTLLE